MLTFWIERKMMKRRKYMPNADQAIANMPSAVATAITNTAANSTSSPSSNKSTPPTQSAPTVTTPQKVPSGSGSTTPATEEVKAVTPGSGSGSSTPSKVSSTPLSHSSADKPVHADVIEEEGQEEVVIAETTLYGLHSHACGTSHLIKRIYRLREADI